MSKDRHSIKEIKVLSAYLDDEMPLDQRRGIDERLLKEPHLLERLEGLRKTKAMVGFLPRLNAPRNYTLMPAMVNVRTNNKNSLLIPVQLVTSLAVILLVVLFSVEFIAANLFFSKSQMENDSMAKSFSRVEENSPAPLIIWTSSNMGGMGGASFARASNETAIAAPFVIDFNEDVIEGEEEFLPETKLEDKQLDFDIDLSMLILGINHEKSGQIINRFPSTFEHIDSSQNWYAITHTLQIVLGFVFILGGLTWWILKSK